MLIFQSVLISQIDFFLHLKKEKVELFVRKMELFAAQEAHFKRYVTSSGNMDTKKEKQEDEN